MVCEAASAYPKSCGAAERDSSVVGTGALAASCGVCALRQGMVDVVQGAYAPELGQPSEPLYCQVTPCLGAQRTGVRQNGQLCGEQCRAAPCREDETLVPCRLPHQTRCDKVWPTGEVAPAFARARRAGWAGPEANLLSEPEGSGFASFENTLLTLGAAEHEYQCVWNAAGISDNEAFPGGVSEYLFAPAMAYEDGGGGSRGSKACALWPLEGVNGAAQFPMLPLQNTVSGAMRERVLTNSEAHVLSYRYDGMFAGVDDLVSPRKKIGPVRAGSGVAQLSGAHIGGRGSCS